MSTAISSELERFRDLLLGEDQQRIAKLERSLRSLREQIEDEEALIEVLEPIMADAVARGIVSSKDDMVQVLSPLIPPMIKTQISTAKEEIVDALYPVIGATIRKSIAESMKALAERVNRQVNQALSFGGIFKKLKSKATGVPVGDLVMTDAMPLQVEEILLIHRKSGLLLNRVSASTAPVVHGELIGGLLTAINNFAEDVYANRDRLDMNAIDYKEDQKIYVEAGPHCYLAFILKGVQNPRFTEIAHESLEQIQRRFMPALRKFDGDTQQLEPVTPMLERIIHDFQPEVEDEEEEQPVSPWPLVIAAAVLATLIVGAIYYWPFGENAAQVETTQLVPEPAPGTLSATELSRVRAEIPQALQTAMLPMPQEFSLMLDQGMLHVRGAVASHAARLRTAQVIAAAAPGATIINDLSVRPQSVAPGELATLAERLSIYFDSREIRLSTEERDKLQGLAAELQRTPGARLRIVGHSDWLGTLSSNNLISLRRARAVQRTLVELGVPEERLDVVAAGATQPLASNKDVKSRHLNRRVEFIVLPPVGGNGDAQ